MQRSITSAEAKKIIAENSQDSDFLILDVRTPEEFDQGHLPRALNFDFYSPDFRKKLSSLDKTKTYLVYCRSGHRSKAGLGLMKQLGFQDVYELDQGIIGFQQ